MLRDAPGQTNGVQRGGNDQFLPGRESKSGMDRDFRQTLQILLEFS